MNLSSTNCLTTIKAPHPFSLKVLAGHNGKPFLKKKSECRRSLFEFRHFSNPSFFDREIGVLILNFIGDAIANLFLSGMFVRRLYKHIRSTQASSIQNQMIEYIARKSLVCLTLTFFVNLAMNLLKVTAFINEYSDVGFPHFPLKKETHQGLGVGIYGVF
jgi:hypothetical protein